MSERNFRSLKISGWRQFDSVEIDFHPQLTILTGANGAGKSSLLRLLTIHYGFHRPFLSTPIFRDGVAQYLTGVFEALKRWTRSFGGHRNTVDVGNLEYSDGNTSALTVPRAAEVQYGVGYSQMQSVIGLHIDSHQPPINYQQVSTIPLGNLSIQSSAEQYNSLMYQYYGGGYGHQGPVYKMKETIIAMATFGEGNSHSRGRPELKRALEGYIEALRIVLPPSLGFIRLEVRVPDIVLVTRTGEFLIDAASGGVACLLDMAWRIYLMSLNSASFVVTMDEPENHLHPSMQRSLLERLIRAFPGAQFVVATHSPFIVSSVKESSVYVLRYRNVDRLSEDGFSPEAMRSRVVSERLDTVNKAGSANEILREVLGVEATVPSWVLDGVRQVAARYQGRDITPDLLKNLRSDLKSLGYEDQYTQALAEITR